MGRARVRGGPPQKGRRMATTERAPGSVVISVVVRRCAADRHTADSIAGGKGRTAAPNR